LFSEMNLTGLTGETPSRFESFMEVSRPEVKPGFHFFLKHG